MPKFTLINAIKLKKYTNPILADAPAPLAMEIGPLKLFNDKSPVINFPNTFKVNTESWPVFSMPFCRASRISYFNSVRYSSDNFTKVGLKPTNHFPL